MGQLVQLSNRVPVLKKQKGQNMHELLAILSAFYGCHALVALRPLSGDETLECIRITATVQVYFLTKAELAMMKDMPDAKRKVGLDIALARFKAWEAANPKAVTVLKSKYREEPKKKETLI
jgi:hypothetical protein